MCVNFLVVCGLALFRHVLHGDLKEVLDKNAEILLRINGFVVGAYGINLVLVGIHNIF